MANTYTPEFIANALAQVELNGGNVKATAKALGIPRPTLIHWRDRVNHPAVLNTIPQATLDARIDLWDRAHQIGANRLLVLIPLSDNLRDVAYATHVALAGYLDLRDGRKGADKEDQGGGNSTFNVQVNYYGGALNGETPLQPLSE